MTSFRKTLLAIPILFVGLALIPNLTLAQAVPGNRALNRLSQRLDLSPERAAEIKAAFEADENTTRWDIAASLQKHLTPDEKAKLREMNGTAPDSLATAGRRVQGQKMGRAGRRVQRQRIARAGRQEALRLRRSITRIPTLTTQQETRFKEIRTATREQFRSLMSTAREAESNRAEVRTQMKALRTESREAVRQVLTDEQLEVLEIERALERSGRRRARRR